MFGRAAEDVSSRAVPLQLTIRPPRSELQPFLLVSPCVRCRPRGTPRSDSRGGIGGGGECFLVLPMELAMEMVWATMVGKSQPGGRGKEGRKEGGRRQEGGGGRQPPRQSPKTTLTTANGGGGGAYSLTRSLARSPYSCVGQRGAAAAAAAIRPTRETLPPSLPRSPLACSRRLLVAVAVVVRACI